MSGRYYSTIVNACKVYHRLTIASNRRALGSDSESSICLVVQYLLSQFVSVRGEFILPFPLYIPLWRFFPIRYHFRRVKSLLAPFNAEYPVHS